MKFECLGCGCKDFVKLEDFENGMVLVKCGECPMTYAFSGEQLTSGSVMRKF